MTIGEVLVEAARRMEERGWAGFSCNLVGDVEESSGGIGPAEQFYYDLYSPDGPRPNCNCWASGDGGWDNDDVDVRVVALCLAAAVASA